jgi:hypothetical protein
MTSLSRSPRPKPVFGRAWRSVLGAIAAALCLAAVLAAQAASEVKNPSQPTPQVPSPAPPETKSSTQPASETKKTAPPAPEIKNEDCAACHESGPRTAKRKAGEAPPFHAAALKASPHASADCTSCHSDIKELPHPEKLAKVDCGACHTAEQAQYAESVHGRAAARRDAYAPGC